jgi:hypothetical protein
VNAKDVAEEYLMRSLPEEEVDAFEVHYFVCAECATMLQHTAEYVDAMRAAAGQVAIRCPASCYLPCRPRL